MVGSGVFPSPSSIAAAAALMLAPSAHAFEIESPDTDYRIRLDLTPKYSSAYRLKNPSPALTRFDVAVDPGVANEDDGDHNFDRGLISAASTCLPNSMSQGRTSGAA